MSQVDEDDEQEQRPPTITEEEAQEFRDAYYSDGLHHLSSAEQEWSSLSRFLESQGYFLRSRYQPGWAPSWLTTVNGQNLDPMFCEDHYRQLHSAVVDAKRGNDGLPVLIKKTRIGHPETEIALFLSTAEKREDPSNHCVPILDVMRTPDGQYNLLVMPLLRDFDSPPFERVGEVLDFARQALEGIEFMHRHGVSHRDSSKGNVMMDASALFPKGFHPVKQNYTISTRSRAPHLNRTISPVKYYFIDFDNSSRFESSSSSRLVTGTRGIDKGAPELSETSPYDPFCLDVYLIGNLLRQRFIEVYPSLRFLRPLVLGMTASNPKDRPTITEALARFRRIQGGLFTFTKARRLRPLRPGASKLIHYIFGLVETIVAIVDVVFGKYKPVPPGIMPPSRAQQLSPSRASTPETLGAIEVQPAESVLKPTQK